MKTNKEYIVLGMALFAMFFGAGNLIFPPTIGNNSGNEWLLGILGFLTTGVGLPLLGILAFNKIGDMDLIAVKVSKKFNVIYCSLLIIALGPLLAIPRTGATTYEMGIVPILGDINPVYPSIVYFGITLAFVLNPSKVIDIVGKVLTPIILIILACIIVKGSIFKIGTPSLPKIDQNSFSYGFLGGYQTMDALGSMLTGAVIMNTLVGKGYTDREIQKKIMSKAAIVAGIGLASVYGGLLYLGATSNSVVDGMENTKLIMFLTKAILGEYGNLALGLCVSAACLTTSIGLVTVVGNYFSRFNILSYRQIVTITCIFSSCMAVVGVDAIVKIAIPILIVLYPITIILIILNLFEVKDVFLFRGSVFTALLFSLIEVGHKFFNIKYLGPVYNNMPLSDEGFIWLMPVILLGIYTYLKRKAPLKRTQSTV